MSNQRIEEYIPVDGGGEDVNNLEISYYYSLGGMNYFTSRNESRGLYLSVTPMFKAPGTRRFTAFSGIKKHCVPLKRFSQKQLNNFIADPSTEIIKRELIQHVMDKNPHLSLSAEAAT